MLLNIGDDIIGKRLLGNVHDADGDFVLPGGTVITIDELRMLEERDIVAVEVEVSKQVLDEHTLGLLVKEANEAGGIIEAQEVSQLIHNGLYSNSRLLAQLSSINDYDENTCEHSIRVAIGMGCAYAGLSKSPAEIDAAITAGLLHDVGKLSISKDILNAPRKLTEAEFKIIEGHPSAGYAKIRAKITNNEIKNAILYHHMNIDGTGYPGIQADNTLSDMQKILHIIDIVDARLHKRPYKDDELAFHVIKDLKKDVGTKLDEAAFEWVCRYVPVCKLGDILVLEGGMICKIISFSEHYRFDRPTVRILRWGDTIIDDYVSSTGITKLMPGRSPMIVDQLYTRTFY